MTSRPVVRVAALTVLLACSSIGRPLFGQPAPNPARSARAAELFEEGRALFEQNRFAEACDRLAVSDRLDPAVGTSGMFAACQEKLGHVATAYTAYRETAERAKRSGDARAEYASSRAAALKPRVPYLLVRLAAGSPGGARVLCDGAELDAASLGVDLPVDPGPHVLEAQAPGRSAKRVTIELHESERRAVTVETGGPITQAPPPTTAPTAATPPPAPSVGALRTAAWIAGGIGIAGVGVAGITGVLVLGKASTMEEHCPESSGQRVCDRNGGAARDEVRPLLAANTVAWVVGGVGLAAGTGLFLLSLRGPSTTSTVGLRPTPATATIGVSAAGGSVSLGMRF